MSLTRTPPGEYLTTAEAAAITKETAWTTRQRFLKGEIKSIKIGRHYRTTHEWIREFVGDAA